MEEDDEPVVHHKADDDGVGASAAHDAFERQLQQHQKQQQLINTFAMGYEHVVRKNRVLLKDKVDTAQLLRKNESKIATLEAHIGNAEIVVPNYTPGDLREFQVCHDALYGGYDDDSDPLDLIYHLANMTLSSSKSSA